MDLVLERPELMLRPIAKYAKDAIDYVDREYGSKAVRRLGRNVREFAFLDLPWKPKELKSVERFIGHPIFWNKFYDRLDAFSKMACPISVEFAHGPGSTGKSRAFDSFFELLEFYSHTDEGAIYTFEWAFDDKLSEFGFHQSKESAYINPKDLILSIPANKNSMPIFLYNLNYRRELINKLVEIDKLPKDFNRDFVLTVELDDMSKKLLKGMLQLYGKSLDKVIRHIQVKRRFYSTNGGEGLVLKQPTTAPNTFLRPITPSVNWDALPPQILNILSNAGLFSLEGALATANHGIYYCDDMFRGIERHRGLNDYLYILRLAEKGDANVTDPTGSKVLNERVDVLQLGSMNDTRLMEVAELDPENFEAIRARLNGNQIEHERCYGYIAKLFKDKLEVMVPSEGDRRVSPNVLDSFSLWVAMTHLFPHANTAYYDNLPSLNKETKEKLKSLLANITLLEKALLYQNEDLNLYRLDSRELKYNSETQKFLQDNTEYIAKEYDLGFGENNLEVYEGCVGLPSRIAERILSMAVHYKPDETLTVVELFSVLEQACKRTFKFEAQRNQLIAKIKEDKEKLSKTNTSSHERDSFNIPKDFPPTRELLSQVIEHTKRKIRHDVCRVTGFWKSQDQIKEDLARYIANVKALLRGEIVSEQYRLHSSNPKPSEEMLRGNERIFRGDSDLDSNRHEFRQGLLTKIGSWQMANEDKNPKNALEHIDQIFPDLVSKLEGEYTRVNKEWVENFINDLKVYIQNGQDINKIISLQNIPKRKEILLEGLQGLEKLGYDMQSIIREVDFAFQGYFKAKSSTEFAPTLLAV